MLAWYVNGRLSEAERRDVERALADAAATASPGAAGELREEVVEFRALRAAVAEVGPDEPTFPPGLIQEAWRRIQLHERELAARAAARPGARLASWFDAHIAALWRNATGVGRLALATQLALVLGLGAALLRPPVEPAYRTSSGPQDSGPPVPPAPSPAMPGEPALAPLRVKVMFTEAAGQQDVGVLLRRLGAEIVAGPSSQGLYTVAVQAPANPQERARALDALVRALEAETALVRGVAREAP